ncbi:MAG: hypothetical protein GY813_06570 [Halieaceae bacterium]|nr:hypothetical protein [Halieaceae bacterium]
MILLAEEDAVSPKIQSKVQYLRKFQLKDRFSIAAIPLQAIPVVFHVKKGRQAPEKFLQQSDEKLRFYIESGMMENWCTAIYNCGLTATPAA